MVLGKTSFLIFKETWNDWVELFVILTRLTNATNTILFNEYKSLKVHKNTNKNTNKKMLPQQQIWLLKFFTAMVGVFNSMRTTNGNNMSCHSGVERDSTIKPYIKQCARMYLYTITPPSHRPGEPSSPRKIIKKVIPGGKNTLKF